MLRLRSHDIDQIRAFQDMHEEAQQENFGHMFRSPTLWEDMVKTITLCNCGYVCQHIAGIDNTFNVMHETRFMGLQGHGLRRYYHDYHPLQLWVRLFVTLFGFDTQDMSHCL